MNIYIKNYAHRAKEILIAILVIFTAIVLSVLLFGNKIEALSGQLESYDHSVYEYAYLLNYDIEVENVYVYSDTDVMLFTNENKATRMTVSSLMKNVNDTSDILGLGNLASNEIILSENVADQYNLCCGDKVFALFSYSDTLYELTVKKIIGTEYDYVNPVIDNSIGMVYLPYIPEYTKNISCKYLLFSTESSAEVLSQYPQIIDSVINKRSNYISVFSQGLYILIFEILFMTAAIFISNNVFFKKSYFYLRRIFLKGERRNILTGIPVIEKMVFCIIPVLLVEMVVLLIMQNRSVLMTAFCGIPIGISLIYLVVTWLLSKVTYRRRR